MRSNDDHREGPRRGLSPLAAALTVGSVLLGCGLISRRYSPDPSHPDIRRWYTRLDKPRYKPPDPVFAAAWPVLNSLQSAGAYRLLRAPGGPARDAAIGLWLFSQVLVTAYGKVAFGDKSLTGGVVTATALVAACAAFVERAARIDGVAAVLGIPITAWSAFGDVLTEDLRERNPDLDGSEVPVRYVRPA
jgi:translocator protein